MGLKKNLNPFKIIVLTARKVDNPEREDFLTTWSKADEYIYKPFELDDLVERINAHIVMS